MSNSIPPDPVLGFLAVRELTSVGLVGGLLLVNTMGRPLEFHCTAPVIASKTQQVLYGSTLSEFLQVEVIGRALVQQTKRGPAAILIDEGQLASLADWISFPVVLVGKQIAETTTVAEGGWADASANPLAAAEQPSRPHSGGPKWILGDAWLQSIQPQANWKSDSSLVSGDSAIATGVRGPLEQLGSQLPVTEPFERIRQAIEEAHGTSATVSAAA